MRKEENFWLWVYYNACFFFLSFWCGLKKFHRLMVFCEIGESSKKRARGI